MGAYRHVGTPTDSRHSVKRRLSAFGSQPLGASTVRPLPYGHKCPTLQRMGVHRRCATSHRPYSEAGSSSQWFRQRIQTGRPVCSQSSLRTAKIPRSTGRRRPASPASTGRRVPSSLTLPNLW